MRRGQIVLLSLLLLAVACAPRFNEEPTGSVTSTVAAGAATAPEATARAGSPGWAGTRDVFVPGTAGRAPGQASVRRGGTVKIGGLFPLSGGLSRLGVPVYQAANA